MSLGKRRIVNDDHLVESKSLVRCKKFKHVNDDQEWQVTSTKSKTYRLDWSKQVKDIWIKIVAFLDIRDHLKFEQTFRFARLVGHEPASWCNEIDMLKVCQNLTESILERFYKAPIRQLILTKSSNVLDDEVATRVMSSWKDLVCLEMHPKLNISQTTWTECLKSWKRLQQFSLCDSDLNWAFNVDYLGHLGGCKHLTSLDLGKFGEFGAVERVESIIPAHGTFQKWSNLRLKHFSWNTPRDFAFDRENLQVICGWPLTSLDLSGTADIDVFEEHGFERISQIKTLEKLVLPKWTSQWEGSGLRHLQKLDKLKFFSVQFVELSNTEYLQDIGKMIHLKELEMEFEEMNSAFIYDLSFHWNQIFPPRLEALYVSGVQMWSDFPENGWQTLTCLTSLELLGVFSISTSFIQILEKAPFLTSLTRFHIDFSCHEKCVVFPLISVMEKMTQLVDLHLVHSDGEMFSVTATEHNQLMDKLRLYHFETCLENE